MTESQITIYSKPECPYCDKVKLFFDELGLQYTVIMLDPTSPDYEQSRDHLKSTTGQNTFPFVYIGPEFVGGYTELVRAHRTNKLHELCAKVGIILEYDF